MASFSIVEYLDVLKQVGPGFISGPVANAIDTLSLEDGEEALDDGIVVAVAGAAHAAVDAMPGKLVTKVFT